MKIKSVQQATILINLSERLGIHVLSTNKVFMKRYLSVCLLCIAGTAAAMGSGSGGGSSSGSSNPLQQEVGSPTFKVYNQGVDLMHAKKFAAAQTKFEQAIRDNPNFAEAHNNLGFTLRQQGPQNYSKALEHYGIAIQLKPNMAETYEYRGVLFAKMGRRADAEKDLVTLKKLNPKLAADLQEFLKTGIREDIEDVKQIEIGAYTVNSTGALHHSCWVPVEVVVDQVGAILEVLPF